MEQGEKKTDNREKKEKIQSGGVIANILFIILAFLIIIFISYLTIANFAFLGILPKELAYKMPIVDKVMKILDDRQKKIQIIKDLIEAQENDFDIEHIESQLAELSRAVSEGDERLYRMHVINRKVGDRNFSEMWFKQVLVMTFFRGNEEGSHQDRARDVADKINQLIDQKFNFEEMLPLVKDNNYYIVVSKDVLLTVYKEDAIMHSSKQESLVYEWINNLRVALGASFLVNPAEEVKPVFEEKKEKKIASLPQDNLVKDKYKELAAVYEKMDMGVVSAIFQRMDDNEAVNLLEKMSQKKVTQLMSMVGAQKVVSYYRKMLEKDETSFKKLSDVFAKMPNDTLFGIANRLTQEERSKLYNSFDIKRKAKLFSQMQPAEAEKYLTP